MSWIPAYDRELAPGLVARAGKRGRLTLEVRDPDSDERIEVELWPRDEQLLFELLRERGNR